MAHYKKEVQDNEEQWKRIEADPTKDEYDAKRFRDIWEESVRMVPDAERRYQAAVEDLTAYVHEHFAMEDTNDSGNEWLSIARNIIKFGAAEGNAGKESSGEIGGVGGETTNIDDLAEGEAF